MINFLMFGGIALLFIGFPTTIVVSIVFKVKKKKALIPVVCIPILFCLGIVFICVGGYLYGQTDEYRQLVLEKEQSETKEFAEENKVQREAISEMEFGSISTEEKEVTESAEVNEQEPAETEQKEGEEEKEISEEEYKALCDELFYDDIFFGEDNIEGQGVKLHLFLTEKYYFTTDDMYSDTFRTFDNKYNMCRDFFKASVLREGEKSYVGAGKVNLWFSEDIDPNDYKAGEHIIVYAEVISWSNNTWDGYNSVIIIPKYIEEEE